MTKRDLRTITRQASAGFTLVELLLVITILGILAAMVVPKLGGYSDKARINRTYADMATIAGQVEAYRFEKGRYPESLDELTIDTDTQEAVLKKSQLVDAWGTEYQYKKISKRKFEIRSAGTDGQFSTEDDLWYPDDDKK